MLERLIEMIDKMIVIIRVYEIRVLARKDEAGADVQLRQHRIVRILYMEHILGDEIEVFTLLIPQIGVCIAVANHLAGMLYTDGTVVGGDNQADRLL